MSSEQIGLQTDSFTWVIAAVLLAVWAMALPVLVSGFRLKRWQGSATSLLGLAWLGFGVDIVFRFFLLAYESVSFGNMTTRLADRPATVVNEALVVAVVYLTAFVATGGISRLLPKPRMLVQPVAGAERSAGGSPALWTGVTLACVVLGNLPSVPDTIVTPASLVASLWIFSASVTWWRHFAGQRMSTATLILVLTPGVVRVVLAPYRENLIAIVLVPFFAAILARRQFRLSIVAATATVIFLISTVVIGTYRQVMWTEVGVVDAISQRLSSNEQQNSTETPWAESLRRFHAFDSLLLTVDLVPSVFPYTDRNVFTEAVIRGFVPRLVYAGKRRSDEGVVFSQTIWNFDDRMSRTAPIAPSMPGNLFESGGIAFVACGAALWALLLGWIDRLKATVSTGAATGIHALFALQAFAGIERDFPHTVSSILQNLVILVAVCLIAGTDSSVSIPLSRAARAEFQRTKPRHS